MDLLRLDYDLLLPDLLVEGYNSLIWTERYLEPGEFELKTNLVNTFRSWLPEYSLVSLNETQEIMVVESHEITEDSSGIKELTIRGKSLSNILKWREITYHQHGKKWKMARTYTLAEASAVIMWNSLVNASGRDVVRARNFSKDAVRDPISQSRITNSSTYVGPRRRRWLETGEIQSQVFKFLGRGNMGLRVQRPQFQPYSPQGPIVSVTTANGNKGHYSEDAGNSLIGVAAFDIYSGRNRTVKQSARKRVIFHYEGGHLLSPQYLFSVEDYATNAWVVSSLGTQFVMQDPDLFPYQYGINYRVLQVEAGSPSSDETNAEFLEDLDEFGENALEAHRRKKLVEGEISPQQPYSFGGAHWQRPLNPANEGSWHTDYYLGDLVTLVGEYGLEQTMRVMEYTRTEDASGDRAFPGLQVEI